MASTPSRARRIPRLLLALAVLLSPALLVAGAAGAAERWASSSTAPAASAEVVYLPLIGTDVRSATAMLSPGGVVRAGGAVLGAVAGGLATPVEVTLAALDAAPAGLGGAVVVGEPYLVGAAHAVAVPYETPLLLGLPVPAGADPARLALALRLPAGAATEGGAPTWSLSQGSYDAATGLFVATLTRLPPEDATAVLVEHEANQPIAGGGAAAVAQANPQFLIGCWSLGATGACSANNKALLQNELVQAWNSFVLTHKFRKPALVSSAGVFVGPNYTPTVVPDAYVHNIFITTAPCVDEQGEGYGGRYHPATLALEICIPDGPFAMDAFTRRVVRHELFHAVQYAYPGLAQDYDLPEVGWMVEGTAALASASESGLLAAPDFKPRLISDPLLDLADDHEYEAQDFWVYAGRVLGKDLDYLQPIFEAGGTAQDAASVIDLAGSYWGFIKNQSMEKLTPINAPYEEPRCSQEFKRIGQRIDFSYPTQRKAAGTLEPLSAVAVEINLERDFGGFLVLATTTGDAAALQYKVYGEGEFGCVGIPDGRRIFTQAPPLRLVTVVVANTGLSAPLNFEVAVIGG